MQLRSSPIAHTSHRITANTGWARRSSAKAHALQQRVEAVRGESMPPADSLQQCGDSALNRRGRSHQFSFVHHGSLSHTTLLEEAARECPNHFDTLPIIVML